MKNYTLAGILAGAMAMTAPQYADAVKIFDGAGDCRPLRNQVCIETLLWEKVAAGDREEYQAVLIRKSYSTKNIYTIFRQKNKKEALEVLKREVPLATIDRLVQSSEKPLIYSYVERTGGF